MFDFSFRDNPVGNFAKSATQGAANWIDRTFDDVPFFSNPYAPKPVTPSAPTPPPPPGPVTVDRSATDAWARGSALLQQQIQMLQNQAAAVPKLPNFDVLANYNKAKQTATAAVTPLYNKKLNLFLEGQGIAKDTKQKETALARENNNFSLQNALGDNATTRTRTGEDLASALDQIAYNEDNFLTDDAQQFDMARRGLMEDSAATGAIDTGLGQQAIGQQQDDRNRNADRQTTEFRNMESAKQLLATRTIADLATADDRATQKKGQDDKALDIDFDSYMSNLANEERQYRLQNELDMAGAISQQTQTYRDQGVQEWLAGLARSGARAQDIALAAQVYG